MRRFLVLVCMVLAGCGDHGRPSSERPAPISAEPGMQSPSVIPSAADSPPGTLACARLAAAIDAGSFMTSGVVDEIVAAAATADAPLADAADRLGVAYRTAVAAKDEPEEPDSIAAVGAVASDMSGVCDQSGLHTAG
jgi:hypothetical protein